MPGAVEHCYVKKLMNGGSLFPSACLPRRGLAPRIDSLARMNLRNVADYYAVLGVQALHDDPEVVVHRSHYNLPPFNLVPAVDHKDVVLALIRADCFVRHCQRQTRLAERYSHPREQPWHQILPGVWQAAAYSYCPCRGVDMVAEAVQRSFMRELGLVGKTDEKGRVGKLYFMLPREALVLQERSLVHVKADSDGVNRFDRGKQRGTSRCSGNLVARRNQRLSDPARNGRGYSRELKRQLGTAQVRLGGLQGGISDFDIGSSFVKLLLVSSLCGSRIP